MPRKKCTLTDVEKYNAEMIFLNINNLSHADMNRVIEQYAYRKIQAQPVNMEGNPQEGTQINSGFSWSSFPAFVAVLKQETMVQIAFDFSSNHKKYHKMVPLIEEVATEHGWTFGQDVNLKRRVGNFYKDKISNARKAIDTILRKPTKTKNMKSLIGLMDDPTISHIIQGTDKVISSEEEMEKNDKLFPYNLFE